MRDPHERRGPDGSIATGVDRTRIALTFRPAIADLLAEIERVASEASVYIYGSVATGQAVVGLSDIDLLTIGLDHDQAAELSRDLSDRHRLTCRAVEIAAAQPADFIGPSDEAYGNRVFLRHYCAHLLGPADDVPSHNFRADCLAARGFNGDIGRRLSEWRRVAERGEDPARLARQMARKTLLAVAGLVSVIDNTWTTDRVTAGHRWSEIEPSSRQGLHELVAWIDPMDPSPVMQHVDAVRELIVAPIVERFDEVIGLWPKEC